MEKSNHIQKQTVLRGPVLEVLWDPTLRVRCSVNCNLFANYKIIDISDTAEVVVAYTRNESLNLHCF